MSVNEKLNFLFSNQFIFHEKIPPRYKNFYQAIMVIC